MKTLPLSAMLLLSIVDYASADAPDADWITKEQVTQKLRGMGYTDVRRSETALIRTVNLHVGIAT